MKPISNTWILPALLTAMTLPGQADTVKFGHLELIQLTPNNAATDITLTAGAGSSTGWSFRTSNRGDFGLEFADYANDVTAGVPITCVTENNGRDNSGANGGETTGLFLATSGIMADNTEPLPLNYRLVTQKAALGSASGSEANFNSSFAYFPYADWYAGRASNSTRANSGANDLLVAHSSIRLGTEFIALGGGLSTLDLRGLGESSLGGVLLVNHAKDEGNYALSKANADGTFSLYVHDNGADGSDYEQDPVAFAFVPVSKVGTGKLVAAARIMGNAGAAAGAGNFVSTKGGTGEWLLKIPGYTHATGVLVISAEGGEGTNGDNIVSYEWSEADQGWIIQSRDLNGGTAGTANLQNIAGVMPVYSFAYFSDTPLANQPPTVNATAGATHPAGGPLAVTLNAADADGQVAKVEVYEAGVKIAETTESPFSQVAIPVPALGDHTYLFKATDNLGSTRTSSPLKVAVVPPAGQGGLYFDGTDDYVTFGDAPDLKLSTFTLECWFKREGAGIVASTGSGGVSAVPLITKGRGENDTRTFNCNYFLGITATGVLAADFEDFNTGLNHPITGVTPAVAGVWNHVAVTFDGADWKLYLNGVLDATASGGGQVPESVSIQHAALGTGLDSTGAPSGAFSGFLDEVRIWDHARTAQEIAGTKDRSITAAQGLKARFGFDQSSGTSLTGSTGLNGTLVNGPLWTAAYEPLTALAAVSVAASDAAGGEFGADKALGFTFTRSGEVAAPLTVSYALAGTATSGADYTGAAGSVTFATGESTATVGLSILADALAEGNETVILGVPETTDYIDGSLPATAVISDKPSQAWAFANLNGNPLSAPGEDADGDGIANLIEYFYGTLPGDALDRGVFEVVRGADPGLLTVSYQRAKSLPDVGGALRWSTNLKDWFGSGESDGTRTVAITETVTSSTAQVEFVEAGVQVTAGTTPDRLFVRLAVE